METARYLRPMGVGEILDSAVKLFRANFLTLVIAQLPLTLFYLADNLLDVFVWNPADLIDSFLYDDYTALFKVLSIMFIILVIQVALVYPLTLSAVTKIASDSVLQTPSSVKNAYTFCFKTWWRLGLTNTLIFTVLIIIFLIVVVIPFVIFLTAAIYALETGSHEAFGGILLLGIAVTAVLSVIPAFIWIRWQMTFPAAVNEGRFVFNAVSRSWDLVKGRTLVTFVVMALIYLIPTIIQISPDIMELSLGRDFAVIGWVFGIVTQGLLMPLVSCTRVVVYFELRARKEGFGLEQRVEQLSDDKTVIYQ